MHKPLFLLGTTLLASSLSMAVMAEAPASPTNTPSMNSAPSMGMSSNMMGEKSDTSTTKSPLLGIYQCKGTDPRGNSYEGTLMIESLDNVIFTMSWNFTNSENYQGNGFVDNNVLASVFTSTSGTSTAVRGVQQYQIDPNTQQLNGKWLLLGGTQQGSETCVKSDANQPASDNSMGMTSEPSTLSGAPEAADANTTPATPAAPANGDQAPATPAVPANGDQASATPAAANETPSA